jgi:hypothetical protein
MPGLNNTIHNTTIYGQVYKRGVLTLPIAEQQNFVRTTMNNYAILKQVHRFEKGRSYIHK